jgi:CubicO group peptidase (beta-lactamase class C family)
MGVATDAAPIQIDSTFAMASCTKLLATIAALQCVERGLVSLDEPVDTIVPELSALPIISETGVERKLTFKDYSNKITLRQLLTHTSGLSYDFLDPLLMAWRASRNEESQTFSGRVVEAMNTPLIFEPRDGWAYGTSVDWAGVIVERVSGMKLDDYFEKYIKIPLGLTLTTFHLERKPEVREKLVDLSVRSNGVLKHMDRFFADPAVEASGGAGLYSSGPDFVAVLADLLRDNPVLLRKDTVDLMFTPQLAEGSTAYQDLHLDASSHEHFLGGSSRNLKVNFGLGGLLLMEDVKNHRLEKPKGTMTWGGATNLTWSVNREKGVALLYASSVWPPLDEPGLRVAEAFETAIWRLAL